MYTEWVKNAVTFGREYQAARYKTRVTDEELAAWLNANPTGSFEDWRKEQNVPNHD